MASLTLTVKLVLGLTLTTSVLALPSPLQPQDSSAWHIQCRSIPIANRCLATDNYYCNPHGKIKFVSSTESGRPSTDCLEGCHCVERLKILARDALPTQGIEMEVKAAAGTLSEPDASDYDLSCGTIKETNVCSSLSFGCTGGGVIQHGVLSTKADKLCSPKCKCERNINAALASLTSRDVHVDNDLPAYSPTEKREPMPKDAVLSLAAKVYTPRCHDPGRQEKCTTNGNSYCTGDDLQFHAWFYDRVERAKCDADCWCDPVSDPVAELTSTLASGLTVPPPPVEKREPTAENRAAVDPHQDFKVSCQKPNLEETCISNRRAYCRAKSLKFHPTSSSVMDLDECRHDCKCKPVGESAPVPIASVKRAKEVYHLKCNTKAFTETCSSKAMGHCTAKGALEFWPTFAPVPELEDCKKECSCKEHADLGNREEPKPHPVMSLTSATARPTSSPAPAKGTYTLSCKTTSLHDTCVRLGASCDPYGGMTSPRHQMKHGMQAACPQGCCCELDKSTPPVRSTERSNPAVESSLTIPTLEGRDFQAYTFACNSTSYTTLCLPLGPSCDMHGNIDFSLTYDQPDKDRCKKACHCEFSRNGFPPPSAERDISPATALETRDAQKEKEKLIWCPDPTSGFLGGSLSSTKICFNKHKIRCGPDDSLEIVTEDGRPIDKYCRTCYCYLDDKKRDLGGLPALEAVDHTHAARNLDIASLPTTSSSLLTRDDTSNAAIWCSVPGIAGMSVADWTDFCVKNYDLACNADSLAIVAFMYVSDGMCRDCYCYRAAKQDAVTEKARSLDDNSHAVAKRESDGPSVTTTVLTEVAAIGSADQAFHLDCSIPQFTTGCTQGTYNCNDNGGLIHGSGNSGWEVCELICQCLPSMMTRNTVAAQPVEEVTVPVTTRDLTTKEAEEAYYLDCNDAELSIGCVIVGRYSCDASGNLHHGLTNQLWQACALRCRCIS